MDAAAPATPAAERAVWLGFIVAMVAALGVGLAQAVAPFVAGGLVLAMASRLAMAPAMSVQPCGPCLLLRRASLIELCGRLHKLLVVQQSPLPAHKKKRMSR